jgi:hypothetical protein
VYQDETKHVGRIECDVGVIGRRRKDAPAFQLVEPDCRRRTWPLAGTIHDIKPSFRQYHFIELQAEKQSTMNSGNNVDWSYTFPTYDISSGDGQGPTHVPFLPGQTIPGLGHTSSKLFSGEGPQQRSRFRNLWEVQSTPVSPNGTTTAEEASKVSRSDEIHEEIKPTADSMLRTPAELDEEERKKVMAADVHARVAIPYNLTFSRKPQAPSHIQDDSLPIAEEELEKEPLETTVPEASELEYGVSSLNIDEEERQAGACVEDPLPIPSAEKTQSTKAANRKPRRRRLEPTTRKAEKMEQDWWRSRKTQRPARFSSRQTRDTEKTDESDTATRRGQTQTARSGELTTGHRTITPRKGIKATWSETDIASTNPFGILAGQEPYDDTEEDGREVDPADTVRDEATTGDMYQKDEESFAPTQSLKPEVRGERRMSSTSKSNHPQILPDAGSGSKKRRTRRGKNKPRTDSTAGAHGLQPTQASSVGCDTGDAPRLDFQQARSDPSCTNLSDGALRFKLYMDTQATAEQRSTQVHIIDLTQQLSVLSDTDRDYANMKANIAGITQRLVSDIEATIAMKGGSATSTA